MIRSDGLLSKCDDPVNTSAPTNRNVFNYWRVNLSTWLQRNEILFPVFFSPAHVYMLLVQRYPFSRWQSNRWWYKGRGWVWDALCPANQFLWFGFLHSLTRDVSPIMLCRTQVMVSWISRPPPFSPLVYAYVYVCVPTFALFCAAIFYYTLLLYEIQPCWEMPLSVLPYYIVSYIRSCMHIVAFDCKHAVGKMNANYWLICVLSDIPSL
jgi:hypothetical protein